MSAFCYACHGDSAPGASTNVQSGVFDAGPTARRGAAVPGVAEGQAIVYASNSSFDATLNGGGFTKIGGTASTNVISTHGMDVSNAPTWGDISSAGIGTPGQIASFRCTSCHDPHGSSNYRLLKDIVNGRTVGGYDKVTPDPWVISNEEGYPQEGWKRGPLGVGQMAIYKPNYTTPEYAQLSGRAMSHWCAACHTAYVIENDVNAGQTNNGWDYAAGENRYVYPNTALSADANNPNPGWGGERLVDPANPNGAPTGQRTTIARHRHPIDVPLSLGQQADGARGLNVKVLNDDGLPLEMPFSAALTAAGSTAQHATTKPWANDIDGFSQGNVTCLTCHRAHGTEASMEGWAKAQLSNTPLQGPIQNPSVGGVNPNFSAALLRFKNRGVCERCHDK